MLIPLGVVVFAGFCTLVVATISIRLRSRLAKIERRLDALAQSTGGPTVREFCADLAHELRMNLPKTDMPRPPKARESDFIRGIVVYLKSRRHRSLSIVRDLEQLRGQISELTEQVQFLLERGEVQVARQPTPWKIASRDITEPVLTLLADAAREADRLSESCVSVAATRAD